MLDHKQPHMQNGEYKPLLMVPPATENEMAINFPNETIRDSVALFISNPVRLCCGHICARDAIGDMVEMV